MQHTLSHTGANLDKTLDRCRELGCSIWRARRTGELVIQDADNNRVRINGRRKDAPRALTTMLNRLERKWNNFADERTAATTAPVVQPKPVATPVPVVQSAPEPEPDSVPDIAEIDLSVEELQQMDELTDDDDRDDGETVEAPTPVAAVAVEQKGDWLKEIVAYKQLKDRLFGGTQRRLDELATRKRELAVELQDIDDESSEIRTRLREAAVPINIGPAHTATALTPNTAARMTHGQQATALYEHLSGHRGVWFSAEYLVRQVSGLTYAVAHLLQNYVSDGRVERRGKQRGTQYRIP